MSLGPGCVTEGPNSVVAHAALGVRPRLLQHALPPARTRVLTASLQPLRARKAGLG